MPGGKNVVVLEYKDRFLAACLLVSLASLLGVAFVFGRDGVRWAKRERARWATLPLWPEEAVLQPRVEPAAHPPVEADEPAAEPSEAHAAHAASDAHEDDAPPSTPEGTEASPPSKPPPDEPS